MDGLPVSSHTDADNGHAESPATLGGIVWRTDCPLSTWPKGGGRNRAHSNVQRCFVDRDIQVRDNARPRTHLTACA